MRPFVFVNAAVSVDGRLTDWRKRQVRISCEEDMKRVDKLRAESDAILVGIGTVLSDNPSLTVKSEELRKLRILKGKSPNPLRVVLDSKAKIPINSKILSPDAKTLVAVTEKANVEKVEELKKYSEVVVCGKEIVDLKKLMSILYSMGVRKLMVEGGGKVIANFLREGIVDRIYVYVGGFVFGEGISFAEGRVGIKVKLKSVEKLGEGVLMEWIPTNSNKFASDYN